MIWRPASFLFVPVTAVLLSATSPHRLSAQGPVAPAPSPAAAPSQFGLGLWSRPIYVGSSDRVLSVVPLLRYYRGPWFARTTMGVLESGARKVFGNGLNAGAQVAWEIGRDRDASELLTSSGLVTRPPSASVGVHLGWDARLGPAPFNAIVRYRQDVRSAHGAQADARVGVGLYGGDHLRLGIFAQATWASSTSNQAYYGIDATEASATGLPAFAGTAGLTHTAAGVIWSYDLGEKWVVQGNVESRQTAASVRASPLAEVRTNTFASAGLAFRF